jgi:hypothetical protein
MPAGRHSFQTKTRLAILSIKKEEFTVLDVRARFDGEISIRSLSCLIRFTGLTERCGHKSMRFSDQQTHTYPLYRIKEVKECH